MLTYKAKFIDRLTGVPFKIVHEEQLIISTKDVG